MVQQFSPTVATVRANLAVVHHRIAQAAERAGRDPQAVQLLVACKYLAPSQLPILAAAGVTLLGENRAQALVEKATVPVAEQFSFDFIGQIQSRKVKQILPHVRLLHAVCTDSVLAQLAQHAQPETRVLVQVNIAGEASKAGVHPAELATFIARCPVAVAGLMTMPPLASTPDQSRAHFAHLRRLAQQHGLSELSMGTSQDYEIAVEEGATIVRLGVAVQGVALCP